MGRISFEDFFLENSNQDTVIKWMDKRYKVYFWEAILLEMIE